MTERKPTEGATLLETVRAYLEGYLVFPNEHYGLVAALWALNTWVFQFCDAVPYLAITAETKRAGKTTLLDLLSFLSKNAEKIGAGTPAALYTLLEQWGGWATLFGDEAERLSSSSAGMMRSFMNLGYRRGESIPRVMPDRSVVKFPCWCPKAFALIGDPEDTLRDRSILFVMKRAVSPRPYRPTTAQAEAQPIRDRIEAFLKSGALAGAQVVAPTWVENRAQEIWEPLWSLAIALGCDKGTLARLEAAGRYFEVLKTQPVKRFTESGDAEIKAMMADYGEKAIEDLASIFRSGEKFLRTEEVVIRMLGLPRNWGMFRGTGLNAIVLSNLVSAYGVKPGNKRVGKQVLKGYKREDVIAAVPLVKRSQVEG